MGLFGNLFGGKKKDVKKIDEKPINPTCSYSLLKSSESIFPLFINSVLFTTDFLRIKGAYL